jgi:hypothetical protein
MSCHFEGLILEGGLAATGSPPLLPSRRSIREDGGDGAPPSKSFLNILIRRNSARHGRQNQDRAN